MVLDSNNFCKSVIDLGRDVKVYFPHNAFEYPTKILPQVIGALIDKFTEPNDLVLDPFAGSGTVAIECAIRQRKSISIDINPYAVHITKEKLKLLKSSSVIENYFIENQTVILGDARNIQLPDQSVDAIITDIPYANMVTYSDLSHDLSTISDYNVFLLEIKKVF